MIQKLLSFIKKTPHQRQEQARLEVSNDEVVLFADNREVWRFSWNSVTKIETYKRDMFTTDLICLDFFIESKNLTYPTNEEMQGFVKLRDQLSSHFPSIGKDWLRQVTFPAFVLNRKVLYERATV